MKYVGKNSEKVLQTTQPPHTHTHTLQNHVTALCKLPRDPEKKKCWSSKEVQTGATSDIDMKSDPKHISAIKSEAVHRPTI